MNMILTKLNDIDTILIYGEVSWWDDNSSKQFAEQLMRLEGRELHVRINSPGGNVFDGIAIHSLLKSYAGKVVMFIDGMAFSIASIIALAADELYMSEAALYMMHLPSWDIGGNENDHAKTIEVLKTIKAAVSPIYQEAFNKSEEEIESLLQEETYFTAQELKQMGVITDVIAPLDVAACFKHFKPQAPFAQIKQEGVNMPEKNQNEQPEEKSLPKPENKQSDDKQDTNPALEIAQLCKMSGRDELTTKFILAGKTVQDVRNELIRLQGEDGEHNQFSNHHKGSAGSPPPKAMSLSDAYAHYNGDIKD